jgi:hypothetical protein
VLVKPYHLRRWNFVVHHNQCLYALRSTSVDSRGLAARIMFQRAARRPPNYKRKFTDIERSGPCSELQSSALPSQLPSLA